MNIENNTKQQNHQNQLVSKSHTFILRPTDSWVCWWLTWGIKWLCQAWPWPPPRSGSASSLLFHAEAYTHCKKAETQEGGGPCATRGLWALMEAQRGCVIRIQSQLRASLLVRGPCRDACNVPLPFTLLGSSLELTSPQGGMTEVQEGQRTDDWLWDFAWSPDTKVNVSTAAIHLKNFKGRYHECDGVFLPWSTRVLSP